MDPLFYSSIFFLLNPVNCVVPAQVKAATMLARRYHVKSGDIVVLSQYRSQCNAIRQQLNQKGQPDTEVCTVVASQGEPVFYTLYKINYHHLQLFTYVIPFTGLQQNWQLLLYQICHVRFLAILSFFQLICFFCV